MIWHGHTYGAVWPMFVGGFLFWAAILALAAWAIHRLTAHHDRTRPRSTTALDYLKERYARGEITQDEYDRIK